LPPAVEFSYDVTERRGLRRAIPPGRGSAWSREIESLETNCGDKWQADEFHQRASCISGRADQQASSPAASSGSVVARAVMALAIAA
ncbi:MAG: hypothetical protein ACK53V_17495, partial [Planctomycetota bacterium]